MVKSSAPPRRDDEWTGEPLEFLGSEEAGDDLFRFAASGGKRLPLGYSLDEHGMMGLGEMGLLVARSGAGKSTWLLNVIANTPEIPTVVFNMEMTERRQWEWLLAMSLDLPVASREVEDVLRKGEGTKFEQLQNNRKLMTQIYRDLYFVSPPSAPSMDDLAATIDNIEETTGTRPERVFIDHLNLVSGARDYEGVTQTAAKLHNWAMQDELALIVLQQSTRGGGFDGGKNDGHVPVTLSSGLYAGEHDADWMWGLYRPEKDPFFKRQEWDFKGRNAKEQYQEMKRKLQSVRGITKFQLIKNRPYGELDDAGIDLRYESYTRRLIQES